MSSKKRAGGLDALMNPQLTIDEPEIPAVSHTKPSTKTAKRQTHASSSSPRGRGRPPKREYPDGLKIVTTSAYLPEPVHDKLREYVFLNKGVSINDCMLEGIDLFFKKHGIPTAKQLIEQKVS